MGALIAGLARAGLGAFLGAGWITQLITVGIIAGSLLTAYGVWHHKIWQGGYDRAIEDIAAADKKANERADNLRNVWRDCRKRNGLWDSSTGKCDR